MSSVKGTCHLLNCFIICTRPGLIAYTLWGKLSSRASILRSTSAICVETRCYAHVAGASYTISTFQDGSRCSIKASLPQLRFWALALAFFMFLFLERCSAECRRKDLFYCFWDTLSLLIVSIHFS